MQSLIEKMGGVDATEKRLDLMFVPNLRTTDLGVGVGSGTTLFNPGKSRIVALISTAVIAVAHKAFCDQFQATNQVSALHSCIIIYQVANTKP